MKIIYFTGHGSQWQLEAGFHMGGAAVGVVEQSSDPEFAPGDLISYFAGWRDYALKEPPLPFWFRLPLRCRWPMLAWLWKRPRF